MKFLFDTHVAIWTLFDDPRLSQAAREIVSNPTNEFVFSVCNIWEIAIKRGLQSSSFSTIRVKFSAISSTQWL